MMMWYNKKILLDLTFSEIFGGGKIYFFWASINQLFRSYISHFLTHASPPDSKIVLASKTGFS
jgi:hypothetical protein